MEIYEKKYKEALEKARQLCAYPTSKPFISDLQDLFPELTESNDERIRKELIDAILGLWDNDALPMPLSVKRKDEWIAWLEKQGKQNHVDKIEPKFQNGQWIVWQNKCYKVNYNGCGYELIDQNGLSTSLEYGTVDKSAHLWTIQDDANDGDVLAAQECYVIFKEVDGLNIKCHCTYHYMGFNPSFHINTLQNKTAFQPATKEQRDILLKAMTDAGYEWDADKKELKEIEDEEYNGEDWGIDSLYHAQRILEKTLGKVDGYQSDDGILDHKCAISAVKKLYEQKSALSEEDRDYYDAIITKLEATQDDAALTDNQMEFLKSLKDRVHPKTEWGEEDEIKIKSIIAFLKSPSLCAMDGNKGIIDANIKYLKSIKDRIQPQSTWKPSEEQIKAIRLARSFVTDDFDEHQTLSEILIELEEQLKKLQNESN